MDDGFASTSTFCRLIEVPQDSQKAAKCIVDLLFSEIWPLAITLRKKLQSKHVRSFEEELSKLADVFTLCCSQIKKSILNLLEIFKEESKTRIVFQESRHCYIERLSWCTNRLKYIEVIFDSMHSSNKIENPDNSLFATPMYFVNWIDNTFEVLSKLSDVIHKNDYKKTNDDYFIWRKEVVDYVSDLRISLDELLLCAMTLCEYCLPSDQHIVKARCQVVLREAKALTNELVSGDGMYNLTQESLKLPIKPSNVNVLIDVLRDVLYALETNTNTALLALLVNCFSYSQSPINVLSNHYRNEAKECSCHDLSGTEKEECHFVKEFDLYNERLMQIGSFAVSCSSDQNRILSLRSGLASLEGLDAHLVPALAMSPAGPHAARLAAAWAREVREVRDSVFLIVDPAAFAEKSKQMMHQIMLELMEGNQYDNIVVHAIINIGSVMHDFFSVYNEHEPDALMYHEHLIPLLADLNKVQIECKLVSNLLSSSQDVQYDLEKPTTNKKAVTFEQLMKRLKLLYTLVNKINNLFHPKDIEDQSFEVIEPQDVPITNNQTHTIHVNKCEGTYNVMSPKKPMNFSRSIFARTANKTRNNVMGKLKKHLQVKRNEQQSFSVQLDALFNLSDANDRVKQLKTRETSILYSYASKKNRSCLRKAVLTRNYRSIEKDRVVEANSKTGSENGSCLDEATSLQITELLDQMNDMSTVLANKDPDLINLNATRTIIPVNQTQKIPNLNVTTNLNSNSNSSAVFKRIWSIPVRSGSVEMCLDDTAATSNASNNSSMPSDVTTLERINDLDLIECKLSNLRVLQCETNV